MELCPHCGGEVLVGAPFCPQCGQVVLGEMLHRVCPICQATLPPDAQFCPECGAPMLVGALPPTSALRTNELRDAIGLAAPPTTPRATGATTTPPDSLAPTEAFREAPVSPTSVGAAAPSYGTFTTFPTTPGADARPFAGVWPITVAPDTPTLPPRDARRLGWHTIWGLAIRHAWLTIALGTLLLLVLAYALPVGLARRDWATGAAVVGGVAAGLAVVTFAGLGFWALRPNRPHRDLLAGLIVTVLLTVLAIGGLAGAPSIRAHQASYEAQHGQWARAITEDRLLGTPAATQQMLAVYATWMGADPASMPYLDTITFLSSLRAQSSCDDDCQRAALADEVEARYLYGEHLASAGLGEDAVTQFTAVARLAPGTTYAREAHSAAAAAILALARQQEATHACGPEVAYYQTLASQYGDTPQGSQAQRILAAGVAVSGTISGLPHPTATTLYLSKTVKPYSYFSDDYSAHPNASGAFTFTGVQPGKYNLSGTGAFGLTYWHDASAPYNPYTITVGQVCPVSAGTYPY